jgi:membrane fusion protein, multidrug efflux system
MEQDTMNRKSSITSLRAGQGVFGLLALLALVFSASGCAKQQAALGPPPPVPIKVGTAELKTVPVEVRAIGHIEAYSTVSIKPQVSGELVGVHFAEGQDVRRGDVLFDIDRRPFEVALQQANANLTRDKASAENSRAQEARYSRLLQEGVVSKEQADQFRTAAETAEAQVKADQAMIDQVKLELDYCTIRSPLDGRTGTLMVHKGNLVKANDVPILVVINQVNPIYVNFAVPEQFLADIKKYRAQKQLKVAAAIPDGGPQELGALSFMDNTVDRSTGTITIKATFANQARRLWPGQFVDVVLTLTQRPNAVVVPTVAVQTSQSGQYVFIVKSNNTVEERKVTTGAAYQSGTVIEQGVAPGESVVTDGQLRLVSGAKVEIKSGKEAGTNPGSGKSS